MSQKIPYDPNRYYTPEWRALRRMKLAAVNECEKCGFKHELNVHHKHYKTYGNEKMEDLKVLCKRCHNDFHHFGDGEKKTS